MLCTCICIPLDRQSYYDSDSLRRTACPLCKQVKPRTCIEVLRPLLYNHSNFHCRSVGSKSLLQDLILCCQKHMNITKGAVYYRREKLPKNLDIKLLQFRGNLTYLQFRSRVLLFKWCVVVVGVAILISILWNKINTCDNKSTHLLYRPILTL